MMADFVYDKAKKKLLDGTIVPTHTFKLMLLGSAHVPDKSNDEYVSDISGDQITGAGYTSGGEELANVAMTRTGAVVKFDADDVAYAALTPSFRYGVIYDDDATSDPIVCLLDFGSLQAPNGASVDIEFDASGIFTLTDA
jgi:hypothetical protein